MRVRHFLAVCLASVVWSGSVNLSLLACEQCDSKHVCSACCQSDDRGLLDRIDAALVRRQPHLPHGYLPQLPSPRNTFCNGLLGNCGCTAAPSCGCERSQASCGCEITPAGCGLEKPVRDGRSAEQRQQRHSSSPTHPDVPSPQVASDAFQPRQKPVQHAPAAPRIKPLQQQAPAETVPTPDSQSDPFRDDSASVLRRVPAQSVQLKPSGRAYRQSYDPQARHESVRMSLSDHGLPGQRPNPTSLSQLPRTNFDAQGSSRQGGFAPATQPSSARQLPAVVTASGLATAGYEQRSSRASSRAKNGDGESAAGVVESRTAGRLPAAGFNPLRSNSRQ